MKHAFLGIILALTFFSGLFLGRQDGYEQGYLSGVFETRDLPERVDDALPLPSPEPEQPATSYLPPAQ